MDNLINFWLSMSLLGQIGFIVFVFAMAFYIGNMVKNKDFVPNPISFGIWCIADIVNYITYVSFSEYWVGPFIMVAGSVIIVSWSLIKLTQKKFRTAFKLDKADWIAIIVSLLSLLIYFVTQNGKLSNVMIQVVITMGFVPIASNILKEHFSKEPLLSWFIFFVGWLVTMLETIIGYQSIVEVLYPFVSLVGCGGILILILIYRRKI